MNNHPTLERQPTTLYTILATELFERAAFFGVRSLLILYMVNHLHLNDQRSFSLYATFMALIYASSIMGGILCDFVLGKKRSVIVGSILLCIGYGLFSIPFRSFLDIALAFLIVGSGLFKPNITAYLGSLYKNKENLRSSGFTLFYVAINIGSLIAPLACGYIGHVYGWHYAFAVAFIAMSLGTCFFISGTRNIPEEILKGNVLKEKQIWVRLWSYGGIVLTIPMIWMILSHSDFMNHLMSVIGLITLAVFIFFFVNSTSEEKKSLIVLLILLFFSMTYFALIEQAGSSLTLFTERNVNRHIFGFLIPTGFFQSINPLFVLLIGPLLAKLWMTLSKVGKDPSPAIKFALGLFQVGIGFAVLALGISLSHTLGYVGLYWIVMLYLFHTSAELFVVPTGLSMVTKLSPERMTSSIVSLWFVFLSFGNYISGFIAQLSSVPQSQSVMGGTSLSFVIYQEAFIKITIIAFALSFLLFLIAPKMKKFL